jgi:hypothetical protein
MFKRSGRIRSAALGLAAATTLAVGGIGVLSMTSAGATSIGLVPTPECGRVVVWTVTNPTEFPLTVTDGNLPPQEILPHQSVTTTVDYSDSPTDYGYFTVIGYFHDVSPDETFYPPDENGHVPWTEAQTVPLDNEVCTPPTTAPPTTAPPTTAPPTTAPPTTTPTTPSTEVSPTTVTAPPTTAPTTMAPETTPPSDESQVSPEQVVNDNPTETQGLAFTGTDTVTLTLIGLFLVAGGVALLRLRRGARLN